MRLVLCFLKKRLKPLNYFKKSIALSNIPIEDLNIIDIETGIEKTIF